MLAMFSLLIFLLMCELALLLLKSRPRRNGAAASYAQFFYDLVDEERPAKKAKTVKNGDGDWMP